MTNLRHWQLSDDQMLPTMVVTVPLYILPLVFVVDSNDSLYAGDPKFVSCVSQFISTLISQVVEYL